MVKYGTNVKHTSEYLLYFFIILQSSVKQTLGKRLRLNVQIFEFNFFKLIPA
jgi:hypothetical protein